MKLSSFLTFSAFGVSTILLRRKDPILGTIILTDRCNLHCKHCSVNNIVARDSPYEDIRREMEELYAMGIRILFFCGGETFLWRAGEKTLRDLVAEAKGILEYLSIPWVETEEETDYQAEARAAVDWLTENGIMQGNAEGDLMLDQPLTRRQFAVLEYRIAKLEGFV